MKLPLTRAVPLTQYSVSVHQNGETPLHVACRYGHTAVVQLLCEAHTNLDIQDDVSTPPSVLDRPHWSFMSARWTRCSCIYVVRSLAWFELMYRFFYSFSAWHGEVYQ